MKKIIILVFIVVAILVLIFSQRWYELPSSPGVFKRDLRTLPNVSPPPPIVLFSGNPNDIQILPLKPSYKKGETMEIKIINKSSQPVTYFSGPGCGILFERKVNGVWQQQGVGSYDFSKAPCLQKIVNAGETYETQKLIEATIAPSGTYRIVFEYIEGKIYSNEFQIIEDMEKKISCTSHSDCTEGFSCWNQLPRGPFAGIPGSKESPGECYNNEMIQYIF